MARLLALPGDCATCDYPKFMHEPGEPRAGCVFTSPGDDLRKRRMVALRESRKK